MNGEVGKNLPYAETGKHQRFQFGQPVSHPAFEACAIRAVPLHKTEGNQLIESTL
jgi:hypothetical protein